MGGTVVISAVLGRAHGDGVGVVVLVVSGVVGI